MSHPLVGIIIVHFNRVEDTLRCAASLKDLAYPNFFTIVVENGSTDRSRETLRTAAVDGSFVLVESETNRGFAGGTNLGVKHARQRGAEYAWFLNADTAVDPLALASLVEELEKSPRHAAAGSKVLYAEDETRIWSAGGYLDDAAGAVFMAGSGEIDHGQYDAGEDCDYLPGCSLLARVSVLDRIGPFAEEYFMYFEETDWCARARKAGFQLRYVPRSVVRHFFRDEKLSSPFNVYYYNRNSRLFWLRHGSARIRLKTLSRTIFRDIGAARKGLREAPDKATAEIFRAHLQSCRDFLCGRFGSRWADG